MATGEKFLGSYEQKSSPEDTDLLVGYDVTNSKTKNFKLSAIWTWIKAKIGTAAFCSVVNNLTTAAEGGVLDARQGKALSDSLTKLNSLVGTTSISGIGGGTITGAISELNSKAQNIKVLSAVYYNNRAILDVTNPKTQDKIRIDFDTNLKNISIKMNGNYVGKVNLS